MQKACDEANDIDFCKGSSGNLNTSLKHELSLENIGVLSGEKKNPSEYGDWLHEERYYINDPLPDQFDKYLPNIKEESENYGLDSAWQSKKSIPVVASQSSILRGSATDLQVVNEELRNRLPLERNILDSQYRSANSLAHSGIQKASTGESCSSNIRDLRRPQVEQPVVRKTAKEIQTEPIDIDSLLKSIRGPAKAFAKKKNVETKVVKKPSYGAFLSPRASSKPIFKKNEVLEYSTRKRKLEIGTVPTTRLPLKETSPGRMTGALTKILSNSKTSGKKSNIVNIERNSSLNTSSRRLKSFDQKRDTDVVKRILSPMKKRAIPKGSPSGKDNSVSNINPNKAAEDSRSSTLREIPSGYKKSKEKSMVTRELYSFDAGNNLFSLGFSHIQQGLKHNKQKSNLIRGNSRQKSTSSQKVNLSSHMPETISQELKDQTEPSIYQNSIDFSKSGKIKGARQQKERETSANRKLSMNITDFT